MPQEVGDIQAIRVNQQVAQTRTGCSQGRLGAMRTEPPEEQSVNRDTWGLEASVGSSSLWLETPEAQVGILPFQSGESS